MATIIVFASTLIIASVIILAKSMELKSGKKNVLLEVVNKFDTRCNRLASNLKFRFLQIVQSVRYIMFVQSKIIFKSLLHELIEKITVELKARQSMLMGQKNIIDRGSVSFYLKKIAENKENGMRGKIVEEMN